MHLGIRLLVAFAWCAICSATQAAFYEDAEYNEGKYGKYVTKKFRTNPDVIAPVLNFMKPFTACEDRSYIFISPRGHVVTPRAIILDANGNVVWSTTRDYGKIYDFRVQQYKGKPHLTFWAGTDVVEGHGVGYNYVLNQKYEEVVRFAGARNAGSDLHVFTITPQNSARYIYYNRTIADTSSVSSWRQRGWVWDSVIQEVDLDSEALLFRWSALDHLNMTDSTVELNAASPDSPWDPFHMNSVIKDSRGNYLISLRYTNAIVYIDGETGKVIWQLGGRSNSFRDLSDGQATIFAGQHDVQWIKEGSILSFFDNRADWYHKIDDHSRGVRIKIDIQKMTAELDQVFENPHKISSASQGSYQTLLNGNVLLGYGFNGVFTEFSSTGEVLCDAYFQPASTFGTGNVQSYHALKFKWTAQPDADPDIMLDTKTRRLLVSWNGATEVRSWLFQGTDQLPSDESQPERKINGSRPIDTVTKTGFETEFNLDGVTDLPRYVRAVGLDVKGRLLGYSRLVDIGELARQDGTQTGASLPKPAQDVWRITKPQNNIGSYFVAHLGSVAVIGLVLFTLVRLLRRKRITRRF